MRVQYVLSEAFRNIVRNLLVVLGAVLAVFISLGLTFSTLLLGEVVRVNTDRWSEDVRVIAFLRDDVLPDDVTALQSTIVAWPEVEEAFYFSKPEALEEAKRVLRNQPAALRMFNEDPGLVPASIRVKPVEPDDYTQIVSLLQREPGIEDIVSAGPAIDAMIALRDGLRIVFWVLAAALGLAAVALIANTIHMAIFARREEIAIMKLVGAGNWFVRTPFLMEGMIEGLVGGALAVGVVVLFHQLALDRLTGLPEWIDIAIGNQFLIQRGLLTLLFGIVVGALGSGLAVRRYLRT
jgi:cell division transport system permease protein